MVNEALKTSPALTNEDDRGPPRLEHFQQDRVIGPAKCLISRRRGVGFGRFLVYEVA
jgi:hypothetical protein